MSDSPNRKPSGAAIVRSVVVDGMILTGFGLVVFGTWRMYPPAAYIVAGVLMLATGVKGARR